MTADKQYVDPRDLVSIAYRAGVIDRHFGRPPRSDLTSYMRGYEDPDPYMPPSYPKPGPDGTSPWPIGLRRHQRRWSR